MTNHSFQNPIASEISDGLSFSPLLEMKIAL